MINFDIIYNQIKSEINYKSMGLNRLYKKILLLCNFNHDLATSFLTSEWGGFTQGEVNKARYDIEYRKKIYHAQKIERSN